MKINIYEITSFVIALSAFIIGFNVLINKKSNIYDQLIVYASGSYLLEEFWVIVNILFGKVESLFSVRLISIFGCFLFLLSYSIKTNTLGLGNAYEKSNLKDYKFISLIVPIIIFAGYWLINLKFNYEHSIIGTIIVLPLIVSTYFNLRYILSKNANKYIKYISALLIVIATINIIYFIPFVTSSKLGSGIIDISMAVIILLINVLNKRGCY